MTLVIDPSAKFVPGDKKLEDVVQRAHQRDGEELDDAEVRARSLRSVQDLGGVLCLEQASHGIWRKPLHN